MARYYADGRVTCSDHRAARPPGTFATPTALQQTSSFQATPGSRCAASTVNDLRASSRTKLLVDHTLRNSETQVYHAPIKTVQQHPTHSRSSRRHCAASFSKPTLRVSSFLWPPEGTVGCYICCHHWTTLAPTTPAHVEVSQPNTSKVSTVHLPVAAIKQLFLVPRNAQLSKPVPDIPWFSPSADTSAHFSTSAPLRISVRAIHLRTSATERSRGC